MPKRIGNIYKSICDIENIKTAHKMARKDKSFYDAVQKTDAELEKRAQKISQILLNHTYKVGLYKTSRYFDRGKARILYKLPYYPDRIIQWAILLKTEKYFNNIFINSTCASLPHRGIHDASQKLTNYLRQDPEGTKYYLKLDIKKFYPNIDRTILKQLLRKPFKDKDLLYELDNIIDSFDHNDIYKLNLTQEEKEIYCQPNKGVPVGSYLSQYLANFYLAYFDHWIKEECHCKYYIRYMDDIVILASSKEFLHNILCAIKLYLNIELKLTLKPNYFIKPTILGIDIVGYRHFHDYKLIRKTSIIHFKKILNKAQKENIYLQETTWCGCVSIIGWLGWANTYHFSTKYYFPIIGYIGSYYWINKMSKKRPINTSFAGWTKYVKMYNKHIKSSYHISYKKRRLLHYDRKKKCKMR